MTRKLDALVAEKVMGWPVCRTAGDHRCHHSVVLCMDGSGWFGEMSPFSPSFGIADAWRLVEEMRGRGLWFSLGTSLDDGKFSCGFGEPNCYAFLPPRGVWNERGANTAPLAICLAALRVVGVTEDEITAALAE